MNVTVEEHASTKMAERRRAPSGPGAAPHWAKGAKEAVGAAISSQSRIWFTMVDGTLSEIFFPTIDVANTRSIRFLVTDGQKFFSDESDQNHRIQQTERMAPCFRVDIEDKQGRYRIRKEVLTDPSRDVLLMAVRFEPADQDLKLYLYVDPNVGDLGSGNDGWVGQYKSIPMLFASRGGSALAVAASTPFLACSAGFIGVNDGCTDLQRHKRLMHTYNEAPNGNVALTAEMDWVACAGAFTVSIAWGNHPAAAGQHARAGLLQKFEQVRHRYVEGWREAQQSWLDLGRPESGKIDHYRVSTAVLQIHESKLFPGGIIASLSSPWGASRGDKKPGGYHVLWPRDMGEAALGRLACGDSQSAGETLFFFQCTQEPEGNWPQNMWLDGTPHWTANQLDGPGFAILLADFLRREGKLDLAQYYTMVRKAAGFLVRVGPCTEQDRWESNAGYTPFTMAVEIAALLAAADFAELENRSETARFLRETADAWNALIDEMTYVQDTRLANEHGVKGYYIRIAPPEAISAENPGDSIVHIKNRPEGESHLKAADVVSVDALALVRFGLRAADDPRILDTVTVIDATLKTDVSTGPVWHRYTNDGYGEKKDGAPFDKTGIGRGWPLFAGERAHYEIARGNFDGAERLRKVMEAQSNECGLIPEQVWDAEDIPERNLFNGRPSGSSMPLVWAHAEYIKLLRSLKEGKVWDMPPQTVSRYLENKTQASFSIWKFSQQRRQLRAGMNLRLDLPAPARVRWSLDRWKTAEETDTTDSGLGLHYALLKTNHAPADTEVGFMIFWTDSKRWEQQDFCVQVANS